MKKWRKWEEMKENGRREKKWKWDMVRRKDERKVKIEKGGRLNNGYGKKPWRTIKIRKESLRIKEEKRMKNEKKEWRIKKKGEKKGWGEK